MLSPENTQRLYDTFPHLYRGRTKSIQESSMPSGFECGDGWFDLLWKLSQSIEDEARTLGTDAQSEAWPEASQVKQKFGSLRFHLENATPAMEKLIEEASKASAQTCEVCGAPGRCGRYGRWVRTLCENCSKKQPSSQLSQDQSPRQPVWMQEQNNNSKGKRPAPASAAASPAVPLAYPLDLLPYDRVLAATLRSEGYTDLRDVPEGRLVKPIHQRIWRVAKSGRAELSSEAGKIIAAHSYPRYYIDFETIKPAVPVWAETSANTMVPFQWSCHTETAKGVMEHYAFLADGQNDPRRLFAESLIDAVGTHGPIFVYHAPFERSQMQKLAEYCPDLAPALQAAIDRIFDLLPIAREHYYHPEMHGSWSIKDVLPTIAPDLAYDNLKVANGRMAEKAFAEIMRPETSTERRQQLRNALLLYCERDTLAMVRIAHYFEDGA